MSASIFAPSPALVNPSDVLQQIHARPARDDEMTGDQAAELDAYLDRIEAEADQLEMVARADEAAEEAARLPESLLLWPRAVPDYLPAA